MMPTIMITTPLEAEHVAAIRDAVPGRVDVIYEPELLPPTRYEGDHKGAPFTRDLTRWRGLLAGAQITWDLPAADDLPYANALRWVQTTSTGVGAGVAAVNLSPDILVTTARGVHARPLAEFTFMALLGHWRDREYLRREQQARRYVRYCGSEVAGRTLVTIGAGDLARGCARLARALDMRTIAIARDPAKSRAHGDLFDTIVANDRASLHQALGQADAVVITVPQTPATNQMIDAAAFAAMKPGIAFVNIGRGQVVDEDALIACLRNGQVGFAALDVAAVEPLPCESPLWEMENVLISPHSASTVRGENARIVEIFVENLRHWLDGRAERMRNILDRHLMY